MNKFVFSGFIPNFIKCNQAGHDEEVVLLPSKNNRLESSSGPWDRKTLITEHPIRDHSGNSSNPPQAVVLCPLSEGLLLLFYLSSDAY